MCNQYWWLSKYLDEYEVVCGAMKHGGQHISKSIEEQHASWWLMVSCSCVLCHLQACCVKFCSYHCFGVFIALICTLRGGDPCFLFHFLQTTSVLNKHIVVYQESSEGLSSTTIPNPRESHPVPAQALSSLQKSTLIGSSTEVPSLEN